MIAFQDFPEEAAKTLDFVLCDIDDTITTDGKLTAKAYQSLWDLKEAGIGVIPVTGRPAGWCDMIVRQWPVTAVVGENGAFVYYFEQKQLKTYTHPNTVENPEDKLKVVWEQVKAKFPAARVSKDQFCRKYDLAIDFAEDPPFLGYKVAEEIKELCISLGAEAKVSSIHVNTWFGSYDKVSMTQLFFRNILGRESPEKQCLFFGDSPNDEPMFQFFPYSCAVENILPFQESLTYLPTYLAPGQSGEGFSKAVEILLEKRGTG